MPDQTFCDFCGSALEPGREFVYQYESLKIIDDEVVLAAIRNSGAYYGEPLRVCNRCNNGIQQNLRDQEREDQEDLERAKRARRLIFIGMTIAGIVILASWILGHLS
jgi:hypothetical protein